MTKRRPFPTRFDPPLQRRPCPEGFDPVVWLRNQREDEERVRQHAAELFKERTRGTEWEVEEGDA